MRYALFFNKETGNLYKNIVFRDNEIPTHDAVPSNCELITFDEQTPNYDLLYAMFVEDLNHLTKDYLPINLGGVTYDFSSREFKFNKAEKIELIEEVRNERNRLIAFTDQFMLVPDYPEKLKEDLLTYRQALRDITNLITPETKNILDIKWPTPPHFI